MDWMRWTKGQLRLYVSRDLFKQDIENELEAAEDDVRISTTHWKMTTSFSSLPSSPVEEEVERRESIKERLLRQLKEHETQCKKIHSSLQTLSNIERSALEWAYMNASYNSDLNIADFLNVPLNEFWRVKITALHKVYCSLKSTTHPINLDDYLERERQKRKRNLKIDGEKPIRIQDRNRRKISHPDLYDFTQGMKDTFIPWYELPRLAEFVHLAKGVR
ncbi:hypothetical protein [Ammoniphilus resinae]|uniref:Uncharacterized protein n=1 Tax=Ammoniphilus resinae TaxID=861532 RepID=A0ABS4GX96_9BACL|nr:hypothetical protein [Ammoniphilus resinae]MBP1934891.1 hypothetical protein [Ammoniphilus resinae]